MSELREPVGLVVLTKAPVAGLAKRRLGRQIGPQAAALVARVLLDNTLAVCLAFTSHVHGVYEGPRARLPRTPGITWSRSRGGNPVAAVLAAFGDLEGEYRRLVAVPSDVPAMSPSYLAAAAAALDRCDVVLGPSWDGGLVLFGAARPLPDELGHLMPSSGQLYDDVLVCCAEHGLTVASLTPLTDLDSWSSLSRALQEGELPEGSDLHARLLRAARSARPLVRSSG